MNSNTYDTYNATDNKFKIPPPPQLTGLATKDTNKQFATLHF